MYPQTEKWKYHEYWPSQKENICAVFIVMQLQMCPGSTQSRYNFGPITFIFVGVWAMLEADT